jgi:hypothetical protein
VICVVLDGNWSRLDASMAFGEGYTDLCLSIALQKKRSIFSQFFAFFAGLSDALEMI